MDEKNDDHVEPPGCEELIEQLRLEVASSMNTYQDKLKDFEVRLSELERKKKLKPEQVIRAVFAVLFALVPLLAVGLVLYLFLVRP